MITGSDWPGFKRLWPAFLSGVQNRWLLIFSILLALGGFGISLFQYLNLIAVDKISWIFWLASIALLFAAFLERGQIRRYPSKIRKQEIVLFALLTLVYFITRLFRFDVAPWNFFSGLFDDAAWDIYFANEYVTSGAHSFQVIFLDGFAGISRELLFHYYITAFFKLFGYNLFVFNISLLVLGYITVLFTALTVSKLLKSFSVGLLAGVLLNFLPFHVTQTFMGHRYAICPPLMMISLYYLTTAFQNKSFPRAVLGGVFAAFCLESAIMGKQYVYSLAGFVVLYTAFHWKKIVRGGGATD
ncbi:MAG: glycosyltransferase family 39 protein, partial [Clostridiales bacterium]|nr:glycosyltransferase family 39 protein [Clostridiales bacterium]